MSLPSASIGGRDVFANLAARLMGQTPTTAATTTTPPASPAPAPAPSSSTVSTPRTMSTPQGAGSGSRVTEPQGAGAGNEARAYTSKENVPPNKSNGKVPSTSSSQPDDDKMNGTTAGPSLRGNADQLAEARQFALTATSGGRKSRPSSRAGRQPLFTKEHDHGSFSSSSGSSHSSVPTVTGSNGPQFPGASHRGSQNANSPTEVTSKGGGLATLHGRPPVTLTSPVAPTPAPTPVQSPASSTAPSQTERWNIFANKPSNDKTEDKTVDGLAKSVKKIELSHSLPATTPSPLKEGETKTLQSKRLADGKSTLKEPAGQAATPPHRRAKTTAAGGPKKESANATKTADGPKTKNDFEEKRTETETKGVQNHATSANGIKKDLPTLTNSDMKPTTQEQESKPEASIDSPAIKTKPSQDTSGPAVANSPTQTANEVAVTDDVDNILDNLKMAKNELAVVNARVEKLERENFNMQKDIEKLIQAEERRKFLGTDSTKVPFGLDVKCPDDKTYAVQAHTELKVYELIRRIRTKADLSPAATSNPRIIVSEATVGHGMTLGEVGIGRDKSVAVAFSYEEA